MLKAITHSYFVILGITLHETHGGYGPSRGAVVFSTLKCHDSFSFPHAI